MLRFSGGARVIDLEEWPRDWAERSDAELAELLRNGAPPGVLPRVLNGEDAFPDSRS